MSAYKITSPKMRGQVIVTYNKAGYLNGVKLELKQHLTPEQVMYLFSVIRYREQDLIDNGMGVLEVGKDRTNDKIALFCSYYEKYKGIKYKVSASDSGKIKHVPLDPAAMEHYFQSDNFLFKGKHSISNFVKYYNELLAEINQAGNGQFPNRYDREFERKLQGNSLAKYRQHLRKIGLKPVYAPNTQNILDWK